ncbi:MAG: hypothetical protein R2746_04555 [Acidimicrobiales bacterium]
MAYGTVGLVAVAAVGQVDDPVVAVASFAVAGFLIAIAVGARRRGRGPHPAPAPRSTTSTPCSGCGRPRRPLRS